MKSKVIASSYFTTVSADSLSAFYGKIKEMEKQSRQKAKLISGIVQFVKSNTSRRLKTTWKTSGIRGRIHPKGRTNNKKADEQQVPKEKTMDKTP